MGLSRDRMGQILYQINDIHSEILNGILEDDSSPYEDHQDWKALEPLTDLMESLKDIFEFASVLTGTRVDGYFPSIPTKLFIDVKPGFIGVCLKTTDEGIK